MQGRAQNQIAVLIRLFNPAGIYSSRVSSDHVGLSPLSLNNRIVLEEAGKTMRSLHAILSRIKSLVKIPSVLSPTSDMDIKPMTIRFSENGFEVTISAPVVALAYQAASEMMDAEELIYLAAALQSAQLSTEDIVVEIGTYVGRTATFIHYSLNELGDTRTPILSIDPFDRFKPNEFNAQGIYRQYLENILQADAGTRCMPLAAFSQDAYLVVPNNIGLLIIDGDHTYQGTSSDLNLYFDKLRPGGLIFLDDYYEQTYPGVYKAFNDFMARRTDCIVLHKSDFAIAQRI